MIRRSEIPTLWTLDYTSIDVIKKSFISGCSRLIKFCFNVLSWTYNTIIFYVISWKLEHLIIWLSYHNFLCCSNPTAKNSQIFQRVLQHLMVNNLLRCNRRPIAISHVFLKEKKKFSHIHHSRPLSDMTLF